MKKVVDFQKNSDILIPVMRDKKTFWKVVFKTRRNPNFKGQHIHAGCTRVHTTFPIETRLEDMDKLFKAEQFNNEWTNGDVWEVDGIDNIFEDHGYFSK